MELRDLIDLSKFTAKAGLKAEGWKLCATKVLGRFIIGLDRARRWHPLENPWLCRGQVSASGPALHKSMKGW
jgi:hypothetical protein